MKKFAMVAALLCGCSALPPTVEIPVAVPCTPPPAISRPLLAVRTLHPDSPPADVMRAYATSMEELGGYALQLENLLNGYRPEPHK